MDTEKLVDAIAEFTNAKIDANVAVEEGERWDIDRALSRNERAAGELGRSIKLFVREQVIQVLAEMGMGGSGGQPVTSIPPSPPPL